MAKPTEARITIVQGDYTILTFAVSADRADVIDLTPYDTVKLAIKTPRGVLRISTIDNDPDNDLTNSIVCFRLPTDATAQLVAGVWPFEIQSYFGAQVITHIRGYATVLEDI